MSVTKVLLDILIVLVAAKAAAELAERIHLPSVVGEIVAGVLIGPSALGLVRGDDVVRTLGELGVILLLLDVGLEMDLAELGAVGRAALAVASVGVVVPFAAGFGVGIASGMSGKEAVFVGAALTATSVGITARVFGDLRALATVEARTVLGAAVADDVIGLVILTVVARIAAEGTVSIMRVAMIVAVALGFLAVTSVVGTRVAPPLFAVIARHSRSSGTLVAAALAFTLGVAELSSAAKLAPIVGAFVAGLAMRRSPAAERVRRELTPVGHLFIPVFFLQIGIDAQVHQFAHLHVLRLAGGLLAVAIVGKLAAVAGMWRSPGDRLLVGIGMIPRGEVGLIFATLGLRQHVFGQDVYAAVLLVVLATTLLTPPLLRWRLLRVRSAGSPRTGSGQRPDLGWLTVVGSGSDASIGLAAEPPIEDALEVALDAALLGDTHRPSPELLDWLGAIPPAPLRWSQPARQAFFGLLEYGGPRAWRLVALTDVLERALPELGAALARRQADPLELDPSRALHGPVLTRVQAMPGRLELAHPDRLLLAALALDTANDIEAAVVIGRRITRRLGLGTATAESVGALVADTELLAAAARRPASFAEEPVLRLAVHLGSAEQARALHLLTLANTVDDARERARLGELYELVQAALGRPELVGRDANKAVEARRAAARRHTVDERVRERIDAAGRAYVLAVTAAELARHAALCEPPMGRNDVRCAVTALEPAGWRVDFVARDRTGLLARETRTLADALLSVTEAVASTWADGYALASFRVEGEGAPDPVDLEEDLVDLFDKPLATEALPDISVTFEDAASPWHTLCEAEGADRSGFLYAITAAFARAGVTVHAAQITTIGSTAVDVFEITDGNGRKLGASSKEAICRSLREGTETPRARRWRR